MADYAALIRPTCLRGFSGYPYHRDHFADLVQAGFLEAEALVERARGNVARLVADRDQPGVRLGLELVEQQRHRAPADAFALAGEVHHETVDAVLARIVVRLAVVQQEAGRLAVA